MQLDEWYLFQFRTIQQGFLNFLALATPHQPRFAQQLPPRGKPRTQKFLAISIQPTALLRELREATSLPYMAYAILQPLPNSEVHQVGAASPQRVAKLATPTNSEVFGDFHSTNRSVLFASGC